MIRKLITVILILLCFVLQSTLLPALSMGGITANLLVILTASVGFTRGDTAGLMVGFLCGLLTDVSYGDMIGFYALLLAYIGFVNGKFSRIFYPEDVKLPIALIIVSDLTYELISYIMLFLLRGRLDFLYYFARIIIPKMIYTIVLSLLVYPILLLGNRWMENKEKRSAL